MLNSLEPGDRDKILDFLFESGNAISECISFETSFIRKTHPAIKNDVTELMKIQMEQYKKALQLTSEIQRDCNPSGETRKENIKDID